MISFRRSKIETTNLAGGIVRRASFRRRHPNDIGVHIPSGAGFILHPSSQNYRTARVDVLVRRGWVLGTHGKVRRLATEGSYEGASCKTSSPLTLPSDERAPGSKDNVRHNDSGDVLATHGKLIL